MFSECFQVRLDVLLSNHKKLANSYNILGGMYVTKRKYHKAIELYQKATDIDITKAPQDQRQILFIRHLDMTTAYKRVRDYPVARQHLNQAIQIVGKGRSDSFYYFAV